MPLKKRPPVENPKPFKNRLRVSPKKKLFAAYYLENMEGAAAARKAGFKNPAAAAAKLLDPKQSPILARYIKKEIEAKLMVSRYKADDVLSYIMRVVFFNPLEWFSPGDGAGMWSIEETDFKKIPRAIGMLVESIEKKTISSGVGEDRTTKVILNIKFVSKAVAMTLAAKHTLVQKHSVSVNTIDWDKFLEMGNKAPTLPANPIDVKALSYSIDDPLKKVLEEEGLDLP